MNARQISDWIAKYGAALLLVVVAGWQLYLAHFHHLTPWLGGGMGMFSSVDRIDHRVARVLLVVDDGREFAIHQQSLQLEPWHVLRTRILPTDERLAALGEALTRRSWQVDATGTIAVQRDDGTGGTVLNHALARVEVWRVTFDSVTKQASMRLLRSHTCGNRSAAKKDSADTTASPRLGSL